MRGTFILCDKERQESLFQERLEAVNTQYCLTLYKQVELRDDIQWDNFEDGFPNIFINNVKDLIFRDVIFLANFYPSSLIFEQMSVIYSIPR